MGRLESNILVISDLHLGEDLRAGTTGPSYLGGVVRLEQELQSFLAHYTAQRHDGRPWRLVVNGDMVDFMSVLIFPAAGPGPDGSARAEEDREYGLGYGEGQSTEKLEQVLERHAGVFRALAAFVRAGNELVVVVGNHDVEFHFASVQNCLVRGLVTHAGVGAEDEAAFRERIRFCPWFYYEEGVVYVEHGHQYDEYCSFDYQLHPVEPRGGVALSIAHGCMRYFTNLVPSLDPRCGELWGFPEYMKWIWRHGARGLGRLLWLYVLLVYKLVGIRAGLTDRAGDLVRARRHRRRLRVLAKRSGIEFAKIQALDGLHREPVIKRLFGIFSTLFIDRLLAGLVLVAGVVVALAVATGWHKLPFVGALLGGAVALNWLLGRKRLLALASPAALRRAPEAIRRILRAPFIVFGHSHLPERVPLLEGGTYYNTGTWARSDGSELFPHLIINVGNTGETGTGPSAELRAWQQGTSNPLPSK